ncbi:MAG TPA: hypothetical protein VFD43_09735 [Planctomycetota bacterium]|nr:hypothetical protein [Planctomycetota bacterium]
MLLLALAALAPSAAAQSRGAAPPGDGDAGSHFAAAGDAFLANQALSFTQYQPKVAVRPGGQEFVVVWSSSVGADVYARLFDASGAPLTDQILVDTTLTAGTQDEPTVAIDGTGRFLVAWTDRHGNDGFQMGVFARVFDPAGAPLGPEFQVSVSWQQSQWEPFAAARPGGGWVIGWTGTDGGKTFMRLFAADGAPLSGELDVAQFNSKQLDPVPAVGRDGDLFCAWIDFDGKAGVGNGTSVFGRCFDPLGNPTSPEFPVNQTNAGEQREARTAADALGSFLVVWEDRQADAEGSDIAARRYSPLGVPLSGEWQVNTTAAGDQVSPEAACDWVGNSIVVWEDRSTAAGEIKAQRYDPQGQPLGGEFTVSPLPTGGLGAPDVALDWSGESIVFVQAGVAPTLDVYARRFRFEPLTQLGPAQPGATFGLDLDLPGSAGMYRFVLLSFGAEPGLPLPDGRHLGLNFDALFTFMLGNPTAGGAFTGTIGPMPPGATDTASFALPGNPVLVGLTLQVAALTLDLGQAGLGNQLRHVTRTLPVTIQ